MTERRQNVETHLEGGGSFACKLLLKYVRDQ